MDGAESSDSDRSANRLCSLSTKFRGVVWSRSFSTAMGGEVSCGREQRFRRSEQVAATKGGRCCCHCLRSGIRGSSGRCSSELIR